ncbi:hypothetical protein NX059_004896 [Plenodomus lindquistii]|nr:hypothetical protein NX059_004896 [Plenodomus lindquistii]
MDAFVSRKRKWAASSPSKRVATTSDAPPSMSHDKDEESTDFKLALLASLHPTVDEATLLEALLLSDGSVETAATHLTSSSTISPRKRVAPSTIGYQSSLSAYRLLPKDGTGGSKKPLVKKGQTLYLYSPEDIENYTPCSIIHNFLSARQADALLLELVEEAKTYQSQEFKLFDRVVWSPHTYSWYPFHGAITLICFTNT